MKRVVVGGFLVVLGLVGCGGSTTGGGAPSATSGGGAPGTTSGGGNRIVQTNSQYTYQVSLTGDVSLSGSFTGKLGHELVEHACAKRGFAPVDMGGTVNGTSVGMGEAAGNGDVTKGATAGTFPLTGDDGWILSLGPADTGQYDQSSDPSATASLTIHPDGSGRVDFKGWRQTVANGHESGSISWTCKEVQLAA